MSQILYLADYFAVIETKEDDVPHVKFRIPEKDSNTPFPEGLELFALPNGWRKFETWQQCQYHSAQLTNIDGSPFWASFFTYYYQVEDNVLPTSLVLISRHNHSRQLKNALMLIYETHLTAENNLERLLSKILSQPVPYPSKSIIRYKLSTKDYQAIQPPLSPHIPSTGRSVANLLTWIGPTNLFNLFLLLLTDNKIALFGKSYSALSESNQGLLSLIYPLTYSFPNIPVLPRRMCDMLMSPVPFIVGVHTDVWEERYGENPDVIGCDLDGSKLFVPECIKIPHVPELLAKEVIHRLTLVSQPNLVTADLAFPPPKQTPSSPIILDKEIRAIFLSFLVKSLRGYRKAIQFTRIHPTTQTRLVEDKFLSLTDEKTFKAELTKSQSFSIFVQERGPPYRPTDLFDKLIDQSSASSFDTSSYEICDEIKQLRDELLINELPNWGKTRDIEQALPAETFHVCDMSKSVGAEFKVVSDASVSVFIQDEEKQNETKLDRMLPSEPISYRLDIDEPEPVILLSDINTRRHLSVMTEYVKFLFTNQQTELKKHFSSVIRAMKSKLVRDHYCQEMRKWPKNEAMMNDQFDYCVRLTDAVLTDSTGSSDQHPIARNVISIAATIYRKLNKEKQFLYTLIQDHSIWSNQQFWVEYFFYQHQKRLVRHYDRTNENESNENCENDSNGAILTCAAQQLANWKNKSENKRKEIGTEEEGIVYANIIDLIYQVVPLLVPFHSNRLAQLKRHMKSNLVNSDGNSSVLTGASYNDEDSDEDEGFNESQGGSGIVQKFIEKIQDRLGIDCKIDNDRLNGLTQLSYSTIHQFADEYVQINRAFKQLPISKPIHAHRPSLLKNETIKIQLSSFLLPDRREYEMSSLFERSGYLYTKSDLLPAEGTIFITNYRVIFNGVSFEYDQKLAIRSIPISSITKVKTITAPSSSNYPKEYSHYQVQIKSATIEFINFAFGIEVTDDEREKFEINLRELRFPASQSPLDVFAFKQSNTPIKYSSEHLKHKTVKGLTMGIKAKNKITKTMNLPTINETVKTTLSNKTTLEKISSRTGRNNDFKRLGLVNEISPFRVARNKFMSMCKTYPTILIQPRVITDDVLHSITKLFKRLRLPTIVWLSPCGSVLARSESFSMATASHLFRKRRNIEDSAIRNPLRDFEVWLLTVAQLTPHKTNSGSVLQKSFELYSSTLSLASTSTIHSQEYFPRGKRQSGQDLNKWSSLQRFKAGYRGSMVINESSSNSSSFPRKHPEHNTRARLIVLVDKRLAQKTKVDPDTEVELLPIDLHLENLRAYFKSLMKLLHVPSPTRITLSAIGDSGWYQLVSMCLSHTTMIAHLLQSEQVSVLISLESGWDLTSMLTALTEIILDSAYRTFDGFQTLLEREFLSFGHRFTQNGVNEVNNTPNPVFILFLDVVHQIMVQNPTSFEFSVFYLETLAYHVYSGRFSTFLLDSDFNRIESGIMFDERCCLWNYISAAIKIDHVTEEAVCMKLINQTYITNPNQLIISDSPSNLKLFNIFQIRQISMSNEYDNLLGELNTQTEEKPIKKRKLIFGAYDDVFDIQRSNLLCQTQPSVAPKIILAADDSRILATTQHVQRLITRSRALKGDKDASSLVKDYDESVIPLRKKHRSHEGYLYKQANSVFSRWKLLYFVIEDRKTLVQYEDNNGDERTMTKSIDLSDLIEVTQQPLDNLPKGTNSKAAIHVRLRSRKYAFVARDIPSAEKWIKALTDCIA